MLQFIMYRWSRELTCMYVVFLILKVKVAVEMRYSTCITPFAHYVYYPSALLIMNLFMPYSCEEPVL